MNLVVVFDTETTGLPDWKQPSESDCQPHMVQLAALLVDMDTHKVIQSMNVIIKPDGWVIPEEVSAIHGITTEHALQVGIPETLALQMFLELSLNRKRVAHNTTFDNRIIRIATKRFCDESIQEQWHAGEYECTMIGSRKIMGGKQPTLAEAYKHFTGKELADAHTALADATACMEVFFAMQDQAEQQRINDAADGAISEARDMSSDDAANHIMKEIHAQIDRSAEIRNMHQGVMVSNPTK